jgi:hypothetical protein
MYWLKLSDRWINFDALAEVITDTPGKLRLFYRHVDGDGSWYLDVTGDDVKVVLAFFELHSRELRSC